MTVLVNILLVVVVLDTALIHIAGRADAKLAGPDKAGSAIVYFMLTPIRWAALAFALGVALDAGGFAWLGDTGLQIVLVYLAHLALGGASVILLAANGDRSAPQVVKVATPIVSYLLPLTLAAYAAWAINPSIQAGVAGRTAMLVLLAVVAAAVAAGTAAGWCALAASHRRKDEDRTARDDAQSEHAQARMAELQILTPDSPLQLWLDFTGDNEPHAVQAHALAMLAERPTRDADLAALLAGDWVIEALRYVRWHVGSTSTTLAIPVRDALIRVAALMCDRIERNETPFPGQFELEAEQAVDLAERFNSDEADYRPALRATRDALDRITGRKAAPVGRARLDRWLAWH